MLHRRRVHQLDEVESAVELARKLTMVNWCACQGFRIIGTPYLFLNDTTGGDGVQEYAVVKEGSPALEVESIAFGWCDEARALGYIARALAGEFDAGGRPVSVRVQTAREHGRCPHCA